MNPSLWDEAKWSEGRIIRGKYRIVGRLGSRGIGTVYKAEHVRVGHPCALKVLNYELADDASCVQRFQCAALLAWKLHHPNAVSIEDVDLAEDDRPFFTMEFVEGQTLRNLIAADGRLTIPRAGAIVWQVVSALAAAHELGIVHGRINPDNIMLVRTPQGEQSKVCDFGVAKTLQGWMHDGDTMSVSRGGTIVCKPAYMSPEAVKAITQDGRSDIYSLGVVMYQMLTGQLPFSADEDHKMMEAHLRLVPTPIESVRIDIPPALAGLVMKCLEKPWDQRPANCRVLARETEKFRAELEDIAF